MQVNDSKVKNIISFLLVLGLILPQIAFLQTQPATSTKPEKMDLTKILEKTWQAFPGSLKKIWNEEILPIWEKFSNWFKIKIWSPIKSWLEKTVKPKARGEKEKRKPIIEEELQKEKRELEEKLPEAGKSLWERFKELIRYLQK